MKFFSKVRQLTLLQSAMDCWMDCKQRQLISWFITNYDRVYYNATRITKRDDYVACNSTRVPPPSLPSLEFKGTPRLQAKTEVLLTQVCMRIFSLNYLSELRNHSLVLQSQPTSKDKKGRSPMNTLNLISIMKSMLLKTKWTHLSPARWYRSLTGIRRFKRTI